MKDALTHQKQETVIRTIVAITLSYLTGKFQAGKLFPPHRRDRCTLCLLVVQTATASRESTHFEGKEDSSCHNPTPGCMSKTVACMEQIWWCLSAIVGEKGVDGSPSVPVVIRLSTDIPTFFP